ncbi:MAG: long-chain fatty acid--CoA ligase [Deltaproteobacteria bacterium]|jgi:long-chain acyl-CoA synthetase|nr:long-chain fatty acid--CoA ligase [Deltaproteobacteria bacterium]
MAIKRETFELDKPDNLVEMFEQSAKKHATNEWMGTKGADGTYRWVTYEQVAQRVDDLRGGLASLGVEPGDTVGIIANNGVPWAVACYATYGRGARFVPMYEAELVQIWKYIIRDSGTKVLFVSTDEIYDEVKGFVDEIDGLETIVRISGRGEGTLAELEERGRDEPVKAVYPAASDIAGLVYTSGTTGDPKGVLLSHGNLTSNIHALFKSYPKFSETDRTLSFLPWAHSYGQVAELHLLVRIGGSTGFAESPQTIVDDLALVEPTMLVAVPRIFNRVYDGLQTKMKEGGGLPKMLFDMGISAAARRRKLAKEGRASAWENVKFAIADKIVFSKIRAKFGGRLTMSVSSSAALNPNIADFFFDIGLPVYEAWGMTELSPAGTVNTPDEYKTGSGGKPLDKVRLVIDKSVTEEGAKDGELIVYGPNVMQGYHNKPEATAETLTEDGGMRTGDRAYIDEDGFLFITGRIKEQFKLENGKFVFPAAMEEEIKLLPYVEHAMIHGLNMPHTVCVVVPDMVVLEKWATEQGLSTDPKTLCQEPAVLELYEREIREHLKGKFGSYEIPKKLIVVSEPFSTENGMLTPTLKLKRRKVLERYGEQVEALYG